MDYKSDKWDKLLKRLPQHEAPNGIWEDISRRIDEDNLQKNIRQLPVHEAPDRVWQTINQSLEESKEGGSRIRPIEVIVKNLNSRKYILAIAASILLLVVFRTYFDLDPAEGKIEYSEEQVAMEQSDRYGSIPEDDKEDHVLQFVDTHCSIAVASCQSDLFEELYELYIELDRARKELEEQNKLYHNEETLIMNWAHIEKEKAEIGKQMIEIILS